MEAEQLLMNHNHSAAETIRPGVAAPAMELAALLQKREQVIQGLNGARMQLEQMRESVSRTEGALVMLNNLILELDPDAFKAEGG